MLYSNMALSSCSKELLSGTAAPGRELMRLDSDEGVALRAALNYDCTISFKNPEQPRVKRDISADVCLLLSAQGELTHDYPGAIRILERHKRSLEYKAGKGSDGDFSWPCVAIKVPLINTLVQICVMGKSEPQLLLIPREKINDVYPCTIDTLEDLCKQLKINVPCRIIKDDQGGLDPEDELNFDPIEWVEL